MMRIGLNQLWYLCPHCVRSVNIIWLVNDLFNRYRNRFIAATIATILCYNIFRSILITQINWKWQIDWIKKNHRNNLHLPNLFRRIIIYVLIFEKETDATFEIRFSQNCNNNANNVVCECKGNACHFATSTEYRLHCCLKLLRRNQCSIAAQYSTGLDE